MDIRLCLQLAMEPYVTKLFFKCSDGNIIGANVSGTGPCH